MNYNEKKNAGTWINLFDAYVMEKQVAGNWEAVGYTGPGSYDNSTSTHTNVMKYFEAESNVWTAMPVSPLNDCGSDNTDSWTITPTVDGTKVKYVTSGATNCTKLTPSWDNLSRSTN